MAHHDNRDWKENPVATHFLLIQPKHGKMKALQQRWISVDRLYHRVYHDGKILSRRMKPPIKQMLSSYNKDLAGRTL